MAVKDTAPYLRDCLNSILAQTYENWELIAVNDHSSDESPKILKEYAEKDSRIRFFNSDRPRLIRTLQRGYREVKGSLINRMDSDDKMPHYKLEVLVEEWLKHGKGTVIAGGTEHFVDEGEVGEGFIKYENWLNKVARTGTHYREIYRECVIPSHCWLLHKEDLDAAGAFDSVVYYLNRLGLFNFDDEGNYKPDFSKITKVAETKATKKLDQVLSNNETFKPQGNQSKSKNSKKQTESLFEGAF